MEEVHHSRTGCGCHGLRNDEGLSESVIEAQGNIASDLDVLPLIVSDRNFLRVVQEDVCGLERGVGEESSRDEVGLLLCRLVLELSHSTEFPEAHRALHDPAQLGVFRNV